MIFHFRKLLSAHHFRLFPSYVIHISPQSILVNLWVLNFSDCAEERVSSLKRELESLKKELAPRRILRKLWSWPLSYNKTNTFFRIKKIYSVYVKKNSFVTRSVKVQNKKYNKLCTTIYISYTSRLGRRLCRCDRRSGGGASSTTGGGWTFFERVVSLRSSSPSPLWRSHTTQQQLINFHFSHYRRVKLSYGTNRVKFNANCAARFTAAILYTNNAQD